MPPDRRPKSFLARLPADQPEAERICDLLTETLDPASAVCTASEADGRDWQVDVHFVSPLDEKTLRGLIAKLVGRKAAAALECTQLAERDWIAASLAALVPVRAGRFVVHGAHDRARIAPNRIAIEVEAALAFGTGHHGTTRGCLLALDELLKHKKPRRILDLGTGSGVLAIAAAKASRRPVLATDIDARAVIAARGNAHANHVGALVSALRAAGFNAPRFAGQARFDLVLANILLVPLQRLATQIRRRLNPGGRVVLSGLLPAHANAALASYRAQHLLLERVILQDGWVTLQLARRVPHRRAARSVHR